MLEKSELREVLKNINEGKFCVIYLSRNSFRVFCSSGGEVVEKTDLINVLYKLDFKKGQSLDDFKVDNVLKKIKEVEKITIKGGGFDKAGKVLGSIARDLVKLKEFKRFKIKDSLCRGCDARYKRL